MAIYLDFWANSDAWYNGDCCGYFLDLEDKIIKIFYLENIQEYNYELLNQLNYNYTNMEINNYDFELDNIQEYSYSLIGDDYGF